MWSRSGGGDDTVSRPVKGDSPTGPKASAHEVAAERSIERSIRPGSSRVDLID
jgi:hypothetical protein